MDITPDGFPDDYLILTGPKPARMNSRGQVRPWSITDVYLFNAQTLLDELKMGGVKIGIATGIRKLLWERAEIYPETGINLFELSAAQSNVLALFGSTDNG